MWRVPGPQTQPCTCDQYCMGRDRQQHHLRQICCGTFYMHVSTKAPAVKCVLPQKHLRPESYLLQTLSVSDNILHRLTPQPDVVTCHFNERLTDCHDGDLSTIWHRPIGQTHETWDPPAERHWVDMTRVNTCCRPCFSFSYISIYKRPSRLCI